MTQTEARKIIEGRFRKSTDRNVSFLAKEQLEQEGKTDPVIVCDEIHADITHWLWSTFVFDWGKVYPNPGGTAGRATLFMTSKTALTYERALSPQEKTQEVTRLEHELLKNLDTLWIEWAGYMVTSSEELACAAGNS